MRQEFRSEKQTNQLHCASRHYSIRIIIAITHHDSYYRSWQGAEKYGTSNAQNSSGQNKQIKINIVLRSEFDLLKPYFGCWFIKKIPYYLDSVSNVVEFQGH